MKKEIMFGPMFSDFLLLLILAAGVSAFELRIRVRKASCKARSPGLTATADEKNLSTLTEVGEGPPSRSMKNNKTVLVTAFATTVILALTPLVVKYNSELQNMMQTPLVSTITPVQMLGHSAGLLTAVSYFKLNIIQIRTFAIIGGVISAIFQYYQHNWIPIKYTIAFLCINLIRIYSLAKEKEQAKNWLAVNDLECHIFETQLGELSSLGPVFGIGRDNFFALFSRATRRDIKAGDVIAVHGNPQTKLYFLPRMAKVTFSVEAGGMKVAEVGEGFIGEMAFLSFLSKNDDSYPSASATVRNAGATAATVIEFDFLELKELLSSRKDISNALLAVLSEDLMKKVLRSNNPRGGIVSDLG